MKKSIEQWAKLYDEASGDDSKKSLELLRNYAGLQLSFSGRPWGTHRSTAHRFFTFCPLHHHANAVQAVIEKYYRDAAPSACERSTTISDEARSPSYLIHSVRKAIARSGKSLKQDGDLSRIFQVMMSKNNLQEEDIQSLTTSMYVDRH